MRRDTIVVGASAGGVAALRLIVSALPRDLPATILVVLHIGANRSILPEVLRSAGPLPARHAANGERLEQGAIYVAPPDCHLIVTDGHATLVHGPKENFSRPAIDPLFRSAALALRNRVIGVVLTGNLDDGAAGLQAVGQCGGITVVEDPNTAVAPDMPRNAIRAAKPHHVLPLAEIGPMLAELAGKPADTVAGPVPEALAVENDMLVEGSTVDKVASIADPTTLTCPECGGTLWEVRKAVIPRYRCHTGHAYSIDTLRSAQGQQVEHALFAAVRCLHEKESLYQHIAAYHIESGESATAEQYRQAAHEAAESAKALESLLRSG